jgi:hypothetical protein
MVISNCATSNNLLTLLTEIDDQRPKYPPFQPKEGTLEFDRIIPAGRRKYE